MENQELDQVYRAYNGEFGEKRQKDVINRLNWIINNVDGENVLDIGCSQGICDILLARKSKNVLGIDIEDESISFANSLLEKESDDVKKRVNFVNSDFIKFNFQNKTFDTILITEVLEHLEEPEVFIEKSFELLKDDGKLIVTVPFGINESPGHLRTYYFNELYVQLTKYYKILKFEILGNWIGFVCQDQNTEIDGVVIDSNILSKIEKGFFNIERTLKDNDNAKRKRIDKLTDDVSSLKIKNEDIKIKLEATKLMYNEVKSEIKNSNERIIELSKEIANKNSDIMLANEKLQIKDEEVKTKEEEIKNKEEQIRNKEEEIKNKEEEIKKLNIKLDSKTKDLLIERERNSNNLNKIGRLSKNYSDLSNSKLGKIQIWYWNKKNKRATKPLSDLNNIIIENTLKNDNKLDSNIEKNTKIEKSNNVTSEKSSNNDVLSISKTDNAILFMATNGAGLGHITRSLAIAKRIRILCPEKKIIFLTTSIALNIVKKEGFVAYHIPPKDLLGDDVDKTQWGNLLRIALDKLFELYNISAVIFDGAFPYAQFVNGIKKRSGVVKIWVKRGGEKEGTSDARKEREKDFDYIIIPGEAGEKIESVDNKHIPVPSIIFMDKNELLSKEAVRKFFKVHNNKKLVYVQLGAGNINDINSQINKVITALRKRKDIMIVIGESIIGNSLDIYEDDVCIIKDYPNSKYFNGFDFVISACGYNSFHELLYLETPAIYLPNMETKTDDQYGRAMLAEKAGAAIVVKDVDSEELDNDIEKMCDLEKNSVMRENAHKLGIINGAEDAAKIIVSFIK